MFHYHQITSVIILALLAGISALQSLTDFTNSLQLGQGLLLSESIPNLMDNNFNGNNGANETLQPCTCGVFLSGQFTKGSSEQPKGYPVITHEQDKHFICSPAGIKQCQHKCLENLVKHLPNSGSILCATLDRDCYKERAYLFVQNCDTTWHNTNLAAGKEYCCKEGKPYQCPLI